MNNIKLLTEKNKCPGCNQTFDCSTSKKCWCFEVDVSPDKLETIEKKYETCLCPGCLKAL